MKAFFRSALLSLLTLALFSCAQNGAVTGTWETTYVLKTGLSDIEDDSAPDIFLNVEQRITYSFSAAEGENSGTYTKRVAQVFQSLENDTALQLPSDEELSAQINNELTFYGTYTTHGRTISFSIDEIALQDGTKMSYEDYYAANSFIGEKETQEKYSQTGDVLTIAGIAYKKR